MKKKMLLWILLDSVFLIVFNTVFFVAGGVSHPASVWISYGFIHFAYFMVMLTPLLIRKSSSSAVFGFSIYTISSVYFLTELIIGIVFIFLKQESYKPALIVQIIVAGLYAIMLIAHLIANESTADSIQKQEAEVAYLKNAASRVKILMDKASDKKAKKAIESVYDLLHSSPSKSSESVHSLEKSVLNMISDLENAVSAQSTEEILDITRNITSSIDERNRRLKQVN